MKKFLIPAFALMAQPALAASKNPFSADFYSLSNSDLIVTLAFLLFVGVLVYFKVPGKIGEMLDGRADSISKELNEAKAIREEAQALLASYERKQQEVQEQSARIVATAKEEAEKAAAQAKLDIAESVQRRLTAAQEQIANAEASAVREVRDSAINVAVSAARDVVAKQMTAASANKLIDDAIATVDAKLH
ncbi:ATP F0F1 synthase subunit B [Marivivens niveibacter]|uniref:ATP synthase subunit b n=1 Tax=Marivivens niveibacter TaxID=1930667 RepID=A0A251X1K4_9RHOB|nr:F0F1 ATP synthase subunit B [Marivivens niveibacter]OUD10268.1 ATP F0F1 synthase subunit B [Marivivens niveibacter]